VLLLAGSGCATLSNDAPWTVISPSRTTLLVSPEERLKLDWTVAPGRYGVPRLECYLNSVGAFPIERARLLVSALDGSGAIVGQRLFWLAGNLPPGTRTYFDLPAPPAQQYRVTVWDYNFSPRGP